MQGPFLVDEPLVNRREFALFLVDADDLATPETGEAGGQPQIRKPGAFWVNTTYTLIHIGNGHYILIFATSELDTLGSFSIRYKSANTAEFQDTGKVSAASEEVSLDEINAKIENLVRHLTYIEFLVRKMSNEVKQDPFLSPL